MQSASSSTPYSTCHTAESSRRAVSHERVNFKKELSLIVKRKDIINILRFIASICQEGPQQQAIVRISYAMENQVESHLREIEPSFGFMKLYKKIMSSWTKLKKVGEQNKILERIHMQKELLVLSLFAGGSLLNIKTPHLNGIKKYITLSFAAGASVFAYPMWHVKEKNVINGCMSVCYENNSLNYKIIPVIQQPLDDHLLEEYKETTKCMDEVLTFLLVDFIEWLSDMSEKSPENQFLSSLRATTLYHYASSPLFNSKEMSSGLRGEMNHMMHNRQVLEMTAHDWSQLFLSEMGDNVFRKSYVLLKSSVEKLSFNINWTQLLNSTVCYLKSLSEDKCERTIESAILVCSPDDNYHEDAGFLSSALQSEFQFDGLHKETRFDYSMPECHFVLLVYLACGVWKNENTGFDTDVLLSTPQMEILNEIRSEVPYLLPSMNENVTVNESEKVREVEGRLLEKFDKFGIDKRNLAVNLCKHSYIDRLATNKNLDEGDLREAAGSEMSYPASCMSVAVGPRKSQVKKSGISEVGIDEHPPVSDVAQKAPRKPPRTVKVLLDEMRNIVTDPKKRKVQRVNKKRKIGSSDATSMENSTRISIDPSDNIPEPIFDMPKPSTSNCSSGKRKEMEQSFTSDMDFPDNVKPMKKTRSSTEEESAPTAPTNHLTTPNVKDGENDDVINGRLYPYGFQDVDSDMEDMPPALRTPDKGVLAPTATTNHPTTPNVKDGENNDVINGTSYPYGFQDVGFDMVDTPPALRTPKKGVLSPTGLLSPKENDMNTPILKRDNHMEYAAGAKRTPNQILLSPTDSLCTDAMNTANLKCDKNNDLTERGTAGRVRRRLQLDNETTGNENKTQQDQKQDKPLEPIDPSILQNLYDAAQVPLDSGESLMEKYFNSIPLEDRELASKGNAQTVLREDPDMNSSCVHNPDENSSDHVKEQQDSNQGRNNLADQLTAALEENKALYDLYEEKERTLNRKLDETSEKLSAKIDKTLQSIDQKEEDNRRLTEMTTEMQTTIKDYDSANKSLNYSLEENARKITQLEETLNNKTHELRIMTDEKQNEALKVEQLKTEYNVSIAQMNGEAQSQMNQQEGIICGLREQVNAMSTKEQEWTTEIESYKKKITELSDGLNRMSHENQSGKEKLNVGYQTMLSEKEAEVHEQGNKILVLGKQLEDSENCRSREKEKFSADIAQLKSTISEDEIHLNNLLSIASEELTEKRNRILQLEEIAATRSYGMEDVSHDLEKQSLVSSHLTRGNEKLQQRLSEMSEKLKEREEHISYLEEQIAFMVQNKEENNRLLSRMGKEKERLSSETRELKEKQLQLQEEIASKVQCMEESNIRCSKVTDKKSRLETKVEELSEQLRVKEAEVIQLKQEAKDNNVTVQLKRQSDRGEIDALKEKVAYQLKESERLEDNSNEKSEQIVELHQELERQKTQITQLHIKEQNRDVSEHNTSEHRRKVYDLECERDKLRLKLGEAEKEIADIGSAHHLESLTEALNMRFGHFLASDTDLLDENRKCQLRDEENLRNADARGAAGMVMKMISRHFYCLIEKSDMSLGDSKTALETYCNDVKRSLQHYMDTIHSQSNNDIQIKTLHAQIHESEKQLEGVRRSLRETNENHELVCRHLKESESELQTSKEDQRAMRSLVIELEHRINETDKKLKHSASQMTRQNENMDMEQRQAEIGMSRLRKTIDNLEGDIVDMEKKIMEKNNELVSYRRKTNQLQDDKTSLQRQLRCLNTATDSMYFVSSDDEDDHRQEDNDSMGSSSDGVKRSTNKGEYIVLTFI